MSPAPRPDYSDYVVHFTRNGRPHCLNYENPPESATRIACTNALGRLRAILEGGVIYATPMPWTRKLSICFTECVWGSLLDHAREYSSYGIAFEKRFLFEAGGGPAFYMREDLYAEQCASGWAEELWSFITPFVPEYASDEHKTTHWKRENPPWLDYTHQREWRVPHDLAFALSDVAFITVAGSDDIQQISDRLPREKILMMDNYSRINELYPWHHF
jgi:hypothetical protein